MQKLIKNLGHRGAKGFTLIELLVVIAIIGILAGIVLASLGSARTGANDAKTKEQLSGLRSAAEIYYSANGYYGTAASSDAACNLAATFFSGQALTNSANYPSGTTLKCTYLSTGGTSWAVAANLSSGFFCVDSSGNATSTAATIANGDTTCN
jgi:prepilin-type N-terminal cleavage/methylation domain-containing protein